MSKPHGTYRTSDGSKVAFSEALEAWVPLAYDTLIATARQYNRLITYKELTEQVQEDSGIRTRMLIANWSGKLLEKVAQLAADAGEVPITALCVHQNGTIGEGYALAPKSTPHEAGLDVDDLAANHRLLCYQRYAEDLPADGGTPLLPPQVADARRKRTAEARPENPICDEHFIQLSTTGECPDCY